MKLIEVLKAGGYNPNRGADGRFASGAGGGSGDLKSEIRSVKRKLRTEPMSHQDYGDAQQRLNDLKHQERTGINDMVPSKQGGTTKKVMRQAAARVRSNAKPKVTLMNEVDDIVLALDKLRNRATGPQRERAAALGEKLLQQVDQMRTGGRSARLAVRRTLKQVKTELANVPKTPPRTLPDNTPRPYRPTWWL